MLDIQDAPLAHASPGSVPPLRIALFAETFLPRFDGSIRRVCDTISHLRGFGHEILLIAPDGGVREFAGARVHGVAGFPFPLYPEVKLAIPRPSIGAALAAFRPDLIHAVNPVLLGASAFYYAARLRTPLVVSFHTQLPQYLRFYHLEFLRRLAWWAIRTSYNRADLTLATSPAMARLLAGQGVRRVQHWRRGVDTQLFHPGRASGAMRARLSQGHPQDRLLLYVGRLAPEKDIEHCRAVLQALPGARLALVGAGPHRARLERYFAHSPAYFAGPLQGEDLAAAFASADTFLLPSRTETLGLVLLEAMAAGCPVVAARAGGVPDIVDHRITGLLYEPGDLRTAAACVRQLLDGSVDRERMVRCARLEAERWSWRAATRQLEALYAGVIAREAQLRCSIREQQARGLSSQCLCASLQISRATLRRHRELPARPAGS